MASVGEELKKERELRGISLIEIAEATKISPRLLRALEDDQFDIMPGDFFTRGIIRTYARYLDLDEENIHKLYLDTLKQRDRVQDDQDADEAQKDKPETQKRVFLYAAIAISLVIVLVVFFTVILRKDSPPLSAQTATDYVEDKETPPPIFESEPIAYELNLVVRFRQKTWMQIYADNQLILEAVKQPGDEFRATAKESFRFNIGNARGYTYTINGKTGIPLGRPGTATREATITLDNYKQFIAEEQEAEDIRQKMPNIQSPFE